MSYHRVRGSISFIVGLFSSFVIIFLKLNEPDPFIFGISAFAGFIVFTSVTWILVGLLLSSISEENAGEDPDNEEEERKNLVDFTIGDDSEEQARAEEAAVKKEQNSPLLESIGPDGKVDWNKLSPTGEDALLEDNFVPLDMFSKK